MPGTAGSDAVTFAGERRGQSSPRYARGTVPCERFLCVLGAQRFSDDSRRLAYVAWREKKCFVVVDGAESEQRYDDTDHCVSLGH